MISKTCNTCKQEKPTSEFYAHPANKDGLQYVCKICHRINAAEWKKNNKEKADETDFIYNTSESGFIKNSITTVFLNKRGKIVNITKPEIWGRVIVTY
jgi:hypothetical protein